MKFFKFEILNFSSSVYKIFDQGVGVLPWQLFPTWRIFHLLEVSSHEFEDNSFEFVHVVKHRSLPQLNCVNFGNGLVLQILFASLDEAFNL